MHKEGYMRYAEVLDIYKHIQSGGDCIDCIVVTKSDEICQRNSIETLKHKLNNNTCKFIILIPLQNVMKSQTQTRHII